MLKLTLRTIYSEVISQGKGKEAWAYSIRCTCAVKDSLHQTVIDSLGLSIPR